MLRDSLVGLIEPMFSSAGTYPLALSTEWKRSSDDRPPCLENPRPEGAESTLTENALSPFHAEPKQEWNSTTLVLVRSHGGNEHGLGYTYADTDIGGVDPVATPRPSERLPAHPMIQQ